MTGESYDGRDGSSDDPLSTAKSATAFPNARIDDLEPTEHGKNAVYSLSVERQTEENLRRPRRRESC
jgi:hypothetical protein